MAHIITKNNGPAQELAQRETEKAKSQRTCGILALVGTAVFILSCVLRMADLFNGLAKGMFIVGLFLLSGSGLGALLSSLSTSKDQILTAGAEGEEALRKLIEEGLPGEYYGIQNAEATFDGESRELDMIVVGPTGVFAIENKNVNGYISGSTEDRRLIQHKIGRQGGEYDKETDNPVRQLGKPIFLLASSLRANRLNVFVNGIVYYSNESVRLDIVDPQKKIPIFAAYRNEQAALISYIRDRKAVLTPETVRQIVKFLSK